MVTDSKAAHELKRLRDRAGYSVRQLAAALKSAGSKYGRSASSYAYYENDYKKAYLPADLIEALSPILAGRGNPPVTERQVAALGGVAGGSLWLLPNAIGDGRKRGETGSIDQVFLAEILVRADAFEKSRQMHLAPRQRAFLVSRLYGRTVLAPVAERNARIEAEVRELSDLAELFAPAPADR